MSFIFKDFDLRVALSLKGSYPYSGMAGFTLRKDKL